LKGVSNLVATLLILLISVTGIILVLQLSTPGIDRGKEILLYQEAKNNLKLIDNSITDVLEGIGSTRSLSLSITDGYYYAFPDNDTITFVMTSNAQVVGIGVEKIEDNIEIRGEPNLVYLSLIYDDIDIVGGGEFGKGTGSLIIKNQGYSNERYVINITV